jgi:methylated-DNA-[protein]-cysteine S-methyltransferase
MDTVEPMSTQNYIIIDSPIGELLVTATDDALTGLEMAPFERPAEPARARSNDVLRAARTQLNAYFRGKRMAFDLPLAPAGTPFQQGVWQELVRIPLGETISYAQLAERVGRPGHFRAVGSANGRNPISLIIPCHRVIGSGGSLTGYGGGIDRKRWLLDHEAAMTARARGTKKAAAGT